MYLAISSSTCPAQTDSAFEWVGKDRDGSVITMEMIFDYLDLHEIWLRDNKSGKQFDLAGADLTSIDLSETNLEGANFEGANLFGAHLSKSNLSKANLSNSNLEKAALNSTNLFNANLYKANLSNAGISWSNLSKANLHDANLRGATVDLTDLTGSYLSGANLSNVNLTGSTITDASFGNLNLTNALHESVIGSPATNNIGFIEGLETLRYSTENGVSGLVFLRNTFKNSGLREAERKITYAIEQGRLVFLNWPERIFRTIAFEATCAYGYKYGRPFEILCYSYVAFACIYLAILTVSSKNNGIYKIWNKDRLPQNAGDDNPKQIQDKWFRLIPTACYFSLLSATRIGWKELNFGSWIIHIQRHDYILKATGWARTISGIQSLISVYLLALWVLIYFGRPFD